MAKNVMGQVLGGARKEFSDVSTVADITKALGAPGYTYTAKVNGNTQAEDFELTDGDWVVLGQAIKGGV